MKKKMWVIAFVLLMVAAIGTVFAQAYASTTDATNAGYLSGYTNYSPNRSLSSFSRATADRYANGFTNDEGFFAGSNAWRAIRDAYKVGYEQGWRTKAAETGGKVLD